MLLKADKNKIPQKYFPPVHQHFAKTAERPRLVIRNSSTHISTQLIDDEKGVTLAAASSPLKYFKTKTDIIAGAKLVGAAIAKTALANGITEVVFDRGRCIFHGYINTLAEAAREGGLKF